MWRLFPSLLLKVPQNSVLNIKYTIVYPCCNMLHTSHGPWLLLSTSHTNSLQRDAGSAIQGIVLAPAPAHTPAAAAYPAQAPQVDWDALAFPAVQPQAPALHRLAARAPLQGIMTRLKPHWWAPPGSAVFDLVRCTAPAQPLLPAYGPTAGSYERAAAPQSEPGSAASPAAQGPHLPRVAAPLNWLNASSTLPAVRAYATSRYTARCMCGAVLQLLVSGRNLHPFDATRQLLLANAVEAVVSFAPHSLDMTSAEVRLAAFFPESSSVFTML